MSKLIDRTGKKYGKLTVIRRVENAPGGVTRWECLCECGNLTIVRANNLNSGAVKSCGCLLKTAPQSRATHNMSNTRLYREWASIKARCYYKSQAGYKSYGARGIKMCDEWLNSFEAFADWSLSNGYSDDMTIERIDNDKDYMPNNCKWISLSEQANNRRSNIKITHNGETHNLSEWCKIYGIDYKLAHNRIYKLGWSFERVISEPVHVEKRNRKE